MSHLFLSYSANQSRACAESLDAVMQALDAKVFNYRRPDQGTAIDEELLQRIQRECNAANFFLQIIDGSLGSHEIDGVSLLRMEFDWFMEARQKWGNRRPRPLILSMSKSGHAPSDNYLKYAGKEGAEVILCNDVPTALKVATGWYNKQRLFISEITTIAGRMDLEVAEPSVDVAMKAAMHKEEAIPQKLLYTSPFGALFWRRLSGDHHSSVRRLYDIIDFESDTTDAISQCIKKIVTWDERHPISLIALGCGDGRREAIVAETLARKFPARKMRVLLVDVSKTLVATAAREFALMANRRSIEISVSFALSDFEHPTTMSDLMRQWSPDLPVVILFLGNTLGNIDFSSFMETVSTAMKKDDLLLTEISMSSVGSDKAGEVVRGSWANVSKQHDDRFDFLTGPVRQLGIRPKREHLKIRSDEELLYSRRTYAYDFDQDEIAVINDMLGTEKNQGKVRLLRVDAFKEQALLDELSHALALIGKLEIYPKDATKGSEVARMGVFLARRI